MSELTKLQNSIDTLAEQITSFQSSQEIKNRKFEQTLSSLTGEDFTGAEVETPRSEKHKIEECDQPFKRLCRAGENPKVQSDQGLTTIQSANLKWEYAAL